MTVAQKAAILVVLAMIGAAGVSVLATSRKASPPASVVEHAPESDAPGVVTVHVAGLVSRPGVYQLPAGARVLDALNVAGGVRPEGDATALNLAGILADGQRIDVLAPASSPPPAPSPPPADTLTKAPATVPPATSPPGQLPVRPPTAPAAKPRPAPTKAPSPGLPPGITGGPVSLNRATLEELQRIPHLGPERAKRIIYYRWEHGGFRTVDELDQVPGFGPKLVEDVRPYMTP